MSSKEKVGAGRSRAHSVTNIKEFIKRKRGEEEPAELERWEQQQISNFNKSAKLSRTPPKQKTLTDSTKDKASENETSEMETILKKLDEVNNELKKEISSKLSDMKEELTGVKGELKKVNEELQKVKLEWEASAKIWRKERGEMEMRMNKLENKIEKQEKEKRRNNLIIKGMLFEDDQSLKQKVMEFFGKEMEMEVNIEEAYRLGKAEARTTVAKCANFEHKVAVLKNKRKLPSNIYIDCDLTEQEREVQLAIRKVAREEKDRGKRTRVGYRKLEVEGVKYEWSEVEGGRLIRTDYPKN